MNKEETVENIYQKLQIRKFAKLNVDMDCSENSNNNYEDKNIDFSDLIENIDYINKYWHLNSEFIIKSHRKYIGKFIILYKKIVRKLLRWYINPIVQQQNLYNSYNTKTLNCIKQQIESLNNNDRVLNEEIHSLTYKDLSNKLDEVLDLIKKMDNSDEKSKIKVANNNLDTFINNAEDRLLRKITKEEDEFKIFNNLTMDIIKSYINNNVIIIGHFASLVKDNLKDNDGKSIRSIESLGLISNIGNNIDRYIFFKLKEISSTMPNLDSVFIINPYLAHTILNSDNELKQINNKVKEEFTFVVNLPGYSFIKEKPEIFIVWDNGFSDFENINGTFSRWACGNNKIYEINIVNTTEDIIYSNLSCRVYTLETIDAKLKLSFNEKSNYYNIDRNNSVDLNIDTILKPGCNKLYIEYLGRSIKVENDDRNFNYCVIDFKVLNKYTGNVYKNEDVYYNLIEWDDNYLLTDYKIRKKLHINGFFEVNAKAFYNKALFSFDLPTSRYLHPDNMYYINNTNNDIKLQGNINLTVIYTARKLGKYREE